MRLIAILEDRRSFADDLEAILEIEDPSLEIVRFHDVDAAIEAVLDQGIKPDIWIVDLMMPHGVLLTRSDTDNGLATGERFIADFLNLDDPNGPHILVHSLRAGFSILPQHHERIEFLSKTDTTLVDMARKISKKLGGPN